MGWAGAVYVEGGDAYMSESNFSHNKATAGGGGLVVRGGTVTCTSCRFSRNVLSETGANGAAVSMWGGQANLTGSKLLYNQAVGSGGAAFIGGGLAWFRHCEFSHNRVTDSKSSGGAMHVVAGIVSAEWSIFSENTAAGTGGALAVVGGKAALNSTVFARNSAVMKGGAAMTSGGVVNLDNSTFAYNSQQSANGGGGALHTRLDHKMDNVTFNHNDAKGFGGAAWLELGYGLTLSMLCKNNVEIVNNHASKAGGGVFFGDEKIDSAEILREILAEECLQKELQQLAAGNNTADGYGGIVASNPASVHVISVQNRPYSSGNLISLFPDEHISYVLLVTDAFEQPCVLEPPLEMHMYSEVNSSGITYTKLNSSGFAAVNEHEKVTLVELPRNNFTMWFQTGIASIWNARKGLAIANITLKSVDCPRGCNILLCVPYTNVALCPGLASALALSVIAASN